MNRIADAMVPGLHLAAIESVPQPVEVADLIAGYLTERGAG